VHHDANEWRHIISRSAAHLEREFERQVLLALDRAVEQDGMISVCWMLGSTEVETNFRLDSKDDNKSLFEQLLQLRSKDVVS
jgi:hypothetical protein